MNLDKTNKSYGADLLKKKKCLAMSNIYNPQTSIVHSFRYIKKFEMYIAYIKSFLDKISQSLLRT